MTNKGLLRIGQVGAGAEADLHLRAFVESARVGDVCLVAEGPEGERLAAAWGIVKWRADWPELLAEESVDVVNLAVGPERAPALAAEALRAGKHVMVAAPPAATLEDFDEMVAVAEASGRRLLVQLTELAHPALQRARKLVAAGEIGPLQLARSLVLCPEAPEGEALRAALYQAAYVLEAFLGPAREVLALGSPGPALAAVLAHESGALGEIAVVCAAGAAPAHETQLVGGEGLLLVRDAPEDEMPLLLTRGRETLPVPVPLPLQVRPWLVARMLGGLLEALAEDHEADATLAQARSALATALACEESARQKWVVESG